MILYTFLKTFFSINPNSIIKTLEGSFFTTTINLNKDDSLSSNALTLAGTPTTESLPIACFLPEDGSVITCTVIEPSILEQNTSLQIKPHQIAETINTTTTNKPILSLPNPISFRQQTSFIKNHSSLALEQENLQCFVQHEKDRPKKDISVFTNTFFRQEPLTKK